MHPSSRFRKYNESFYRRSDLALVVCNAATAQGFKNCSEYAKEFAKHSPLCKGILIGSHLDEASNIPQVKLDAQQYMEQVQSLKFYLTHFLVSCNASSPTTSVHQQIVQYMAHLLVRSFKHWSHKKKKQEIAKSTNTSSTCITS